MGNLGEQIRKLRLKNGWSQIELAKKLSISNTTLSQYETGVRTPDDALKIQMADLFEVSLDCLMGRPQKQKPDGIPAELMEKISSNPSRMDFVQLLPLLPDEDIEYLLKVAKTILERPQK